MKALMLSGVVFLLAFAACLAQEPREQVINGTVIQKMEDGILVHCESDPSFGVHKAVGIVLVSGNGVKDIFGGQHVHFRATLKGTFKYTTVKGAESIVQEFERD